MAYYDLRYALRHLWRRKMYTGIILLSLTIGFTCTSLLVSFLMAETNTDTFHTHASRTFQLLSSDPFAEGKGKMAYVPAFLPDYLKTNFAEIEKVVQVGTLGEVTLENHTGAFHDIAVLSVDSSFFSVFDFPVMSGSSKKRLTSETIVLSKEKAMVLFGKTDVVGDYLITLSMADTSRVLVVSGVLDKAPENSHLIFDALISHEVLRNKWRGGASYVLLNEQADNKILETKINTDAARPGLLGPGKVDYYLEPLMSSYFNAVNKTTYMKTRSALFIGVGAVVCGLIFFMASFNFISLFLLSLQARRKDAGIKKTLGISVSKLIRSSFTEVAVYVAVALILAAVLMVIVLPYFNVLLEASMPLSYLWRIDVLMAIGGTVLALGLVVVLFAVAQQRKVQAVNLMRNAATTKVSFSRALFTTQFIIAITLAISAITIIRQMKFLEEEPLGFNRYILRLQAPDKSLAAKMPALKADVMRINGVQQAAVASGNPVSGNWMARYDLENGAFYSPYLFSGDEDYMKTLGLVLLEGEYPSSANKGKLVNETLVKTFHLTHPVGEKIPGTDDVIIGVVKDFTCTSFKEAIQPAIVSYSIDNSRLLIDYTGQQVTEILPQIEQAWSRIFPDHPFTYQTLQEELMKKYRQETFFYKIVVAFAISSMIICCFGLFALSWAVVQSRMREMGVRKILGASAIDVMNLLTLSFVKRIAIAFVISIPIGYYLMDKWLQNFAVKISMNAWIFAVAALVVVAVAFVTLSVQTVRAALSNPIEELKNE